MKYQEKLGLQVLLGGILFIVGTYALFKLFGDSRLLALFAIAGWFVVMGFCLKFMSASEKDK